MTETATRPAAELTLIDRERALLRFLAGLIAERQRLAAEADATHQAQIKAADQEWQETRQRCQSRFATEKAAVESALGQARQLAESRFQAEFTAKKNEQDQRQTALEDCQDSATQAAEKEHQEARWTTGTVYDAKVKAAQKPFDEAQHQVNAALHKIQGLQDTGQRILSEQRQAGVIGKVRAEGSASRHHADPLKNLEICLSEGELILQDLRSLRLPRYFRGFWPLALPLVLGLVIGVPLFLLYPSGLVGGRYPVWAVSVTAAFLVSLAVGSLLYVLIRLKVTDLYRQLCMAVADAQTSCQKHLQVAGQKHQEEQVRLAEAKRLRDEQIRQIDERHRQKQAAIEQKVEAETREIQKYPQLLAQIQQRRDQGLAQAEDQARKRIEQLKQQTEQELRQAEEKHRQLLKESQDQFDQARQTWTMRWQQGLAKCQAVLSQIHRENQTRFPAWDQPSWQQWTPPHALSKVIRFGEMQVNPSTLVDGVTGDGLPAPFTLPALLGFPQRSSVLLKARDDGREPAIRALQSIMLRLVTSLPPGKVRFTIVDPVGLGENFAAFMHLADFDEALVTSRIWTEAEQIEQQLIDIAQHMENVIQKYLRNQYQSIEQYNQAAGEVAEPYRFLVVANFPTNFSPESARRLVSIATSGPACGVYTLVGVDTRLPLPQEFNLADLEQVSVTLNWRNGRFEWKDADFGRFPLQFEPPPPSDFATQVLRVVGESAKDASRVEVPFDFIAPREEEWWVGDSRCGLQVAIGRAGATKRQLLQLGQGTSQHVLVAGKTGSGKSTLLHVLITNLALCYRPDEVELYLVDFKKGVEFKTYAAHRLPHARVVAIESEREFGLSVLQRLDAELKRRGELFRDTGVQNLADYRDATGQKMPRIMLIVDEFQEFFVEDDRVAQDAALLLDRLVRQGRAFGLHVLLGSQTLGGAYTLARSTIDQMAVRIALQCSEADGYLILSKDNPAARLLSRPGEAIYNDANGLLEGNDIFQVVWLADTLREELMRKIDVLGGQQRVAAQPQIVFEGNAPADITRNEALGQLLGSAAWPQVRSATVWLGEAVAIKEPTAASFRRQSGANLLLIGPHEDGARGILANALVSLALQHEPAVKIYLFDGTPVDVPHAGFLARLADGLPHAIRNVAWAERTPVLAEAAAEINRRHESHDSEAPPLYFFVYSLQRFRELRRADDDFGFGKKDDDKLNPAKAFQTILTEGPAVGVHTLLWCDTLTNLQRVVDRQGMRSFEMRVLFQMSGNDSSTLIDSPAASKLGLHRALFCSEELGLIEKFRPYGMPESRWLNEAKTLLQRRVQGGN